jgi:16S rRNA (cytosine1402-N4)-methyltransferase
MDKERSRHVPVMLEEVLQFLRPVPGGRYIDATLGGGGHTRALLEHSAPNGKVLGIDADVQALERARAEFSASINSGRLMLAHGNFAELSSIASVASFTAVQGVVLDLGFSSDQMDDPQRGFSFSADGPLDMRMDQSLALSAADLVNGASEQELADIFWRYGEERRSRQIARRIVLAREKGPITRTTQLAALASAGTFHKPGTIHPATRVFQALRIAVNHELERLATALPQIIDVLDKRKTSGMRGEEGRMVIISFHSLEDRIVKEFMRREATDCLCPPHTPVCVCGHKARLRLLTSKPVTATLREVEQNPRARSAKLRAAKVVVD